MDPITIALGLAQVAPMIMKYFGAGEQSTAVAEKIVAVAQTVTGTQDPARATAMLQTDPKLAYEFNTALLVADRDLELAFLADRRDARSRDVEYIKQGRYNWRADILAVLAVGGLVLCVFFIARDIDLPERAVNAIMFVAGVLASAVRDVYGFEFGSSKGSREKDQTITEALKGRRQM